MSALSDLWAKLAGSKEYRHALVASELKRGLPRQVRILRKQREWNQQQLAGEAGLTQGAISRAEDPDYGNLTLNNLLRLGLGLDVAFVGRFVPFSKFAKWHASLGDESQLQVPSFDADTCAERKGPQLEVGEQKLAGAGRVVPIGQAGASAERSFIMKSPPQRQMKLFSGGANVDVLLPGSGSTQGSNDTWQQCA